MIQILLPLLSLIPTPFNQRSDLALENLTLCQHFVILQRSHREPRLRLV
jgi:hypothetical protein